MFNVANWHVFKPINVQLLKKKLKELENAAKSKSKSKSKPTKKENKLSTEEINEKNQKIKDIKTKIKILKTALKLLGISMSGKETSNNNNNNDANNNNNKNQKENKQYASLAHLLFNHTPLVSEGIHQLQKTDLDINIPQASQPPLNEFINASINEQPVALPMPYFTDDIPNNNNIRILNTPQYKQLDIQPLINGNMISDLRTSILKHEYEAELEKISDRKIIRNKCVAKIRYRIYHINSLLDEIKLYKDETDKSRIDIDGIEHLYVKTIDDALQSYIDGDILELCEGKHIVKGTKKIYASLIIRSKVTSLNYDTIIENKTNSKHFIWCIGDETRVEFNNILIRSRGSHYGIIKISLRAQFIAKNCIFDCNGYEGIVLEHESKLWLNCCLMEQSVGAAIHINPGCKACLERTTITKCGNGNNRLLHGQGAVVIYVNDIDYAKHLLRKVPSLRFPTMDKVPDMVLNPDATLAAMFRGRTYLYLCECKLQCNNGFGIAFETTTNFHSLQVPVIASMIDGSLTVRETHFLENSYGNMGKIPSHWIPDYLNRIEQQTKKINPLLFRQDPANVLNINRNNTRRNNIINNNNNNALSNDNPNDDIFQGLITRVPLPPLPSNLKRCGGLMNLNNVIIENEITKNNQEEDTKIDEDIDLIKQSNIKNKNKNINSKKRNRLLIDNNDGSYRYFIDNNNNNNNINNPRKKRRISLPLKPLNINNAAYNDKINQNKIKNQKKNDDDDDDNKNNNNKNSHLDNEIKSTESSRTRNKDFIDQKKDNISNDTLLAGQTMNSDTKLISKNGKIFLYNQTDGNLCLYITRNNKCVWDTCHTGGVGDVPNSDRPCKLMMQNDGNLCLYNSKDECIWDTYYFGGVGNVSKSDRPCKLIMQDDGNLCLYDRNNKCLWDTCHKGGVGNIQDQL